MRPALSGGGDGRSVRSASPSRIGAPARRPGICASARRPGICAPARIVLAVAAIVTLLAACDRRRGEEPTPMGFDAERAFSGPVDAGYGAAVAVGPDGAVRVGAPWDEGGGLFREAERVLVGAPGDWLGAAVVGGADVLVAAPGRSGGVVLSEDGTVVIAGQVGARLGGRLARAPDGLVSIGAAGVVGPGGWLSEEPLWSLAVLRSGRSVHLVAGRAAGGVQVDGRRVDAAGSSGRGLAACDLDGDGRDELVLGDPRTGRVEIHVVADPATFTLGAPTTVHELGVGAGSAILCVGRGLAVGAPDRLGGGGVAWLRAPLDLRRAPDWLDATAGVHGGHSLAYADGWLYAGDPGAGRVVGLRARMPR